MPQPRTRDNLAARIRALPNVLRGTARRGGFTMIEIMTAVVLTIVGLVGLMAMQIVAIEANTTARRTTEATHIAETFVEELQQDATHWTTTNVLTSTSLLKEVTDTGADTWVIANGNEPVNVYGVPKSALPSQGAGLAKYCVAYKLSWAVPNEVLSGFVRVYWARKPGSSVLATCGSDQTPITPIELDTSVANADMVTLPFAVRRTEVN